MRGVRAEVLVLSQRGRGTKSLEAWEDWAVEEGDYVPKDMMRMEMKTCILEEATFGVTGHFMAFIRGQKLVCVSLLLKEPYCF